VVRIAVISYSVPQDDTGLLSPASRETAEPASAPPRSRWTTSPNSWARDRAAAGRAWARL